MQLLIGLYLLQFFVFFLSAFFTVQYLTCRFRKCMCFHADIRHDLGICILARAIKLISSSNQIIAFSAERNFIGSRIFFKKKTLNCCQKCLGVGLFAWQTLNADADCLLLFFCAFLLLFSLFTSNLRTVFFSTLLLLLCVLFFVKSYFFYFR